MRNKTLGICIILALVSMLAMIPLASAVDAPHPPSADFSGTPDNGTAPLTVVFTGISDGSGPLTWLWDFGDGSAENETLQNPVHTYTIIGTHNVSMEVCKGSSCAITTKFNFITVSPPPVAPVADFSGTPLSGLAPLTVTFTDNSTGTAPLIHEWDFGDGSAENATVQNP